MRFISAALLLALTPCLATAEIEYRDISTKDGGQMQLCARYPDSNKFPGKRPVLFFIQGSGLYDTCLRLNNPWGEGIVNRGVIVYGRQKRGVRVDPATSEIEINKDVFAQNDIPSLKADSILAFEDIKTDPRVDLARIAVGGGSEGVWMATAIALKHPEIRELSLISSGIERFDVLFERQLAKLIPSELIEAMDEDKSGQLSNTELPDDALTERGLLSFGEIDKNHDGQINADELAMEIHRALIYALATEDNTFLLSDFGGGISLKWLRSAYRVEPLGPQILSLNMPIRLHHGRADTNASVEPVYELEHLARSVHKENIQFSYYDGLGHALTKEILYQILFDLADNLNKP